VKTAFLPVSGTEQAYSRFNRQETVLSRSLQKNFRGFASACLSAGRSVLEEPGENDFFGNGTVLLKVLEQAARNHFK